MATALALTQPPALSVALVEKAERASRKIGETLQPDARGLLESLGLWEAFLTDEHLESYGTRACWGSEQVYYNDFLLNPYGKGWHLDRQRFEAMLARQAQARGISLYLGARVLGYHGRHEGWSLRIRHADAVSMLHATFVVDATGRQRYFARRQGAEPVVFDTLCGVFVFFAIDTAHPQQDTFTLIEACEEGWWYSALLPASRLVVGLMTDADVVRQQQLRHLPHWYARLHTTVQTRQRVQHAQPLSAPTVTSANSYILDRMWASGWAAVGDAASTFDPLSSQGIVKAMRWGLNASHAIKAYLQGHDEALRQYENDVREEYDAYLGVKQQYYRMEQRWPHAAFWRHRHEPITLNPRQTLHCVEPSLAHHLNMYLPASELTLLCRRCRTPTAAHELVSSFKARSPRTYSDKHIILALQYLQTQGVVLALGSSSIPMP